MNAKEALEKCEEAKKTWKLGGREELWPGFMEAAEQALRDQVRRGSLEGEGLEGFLELVADREELLTHIVRTICQRSDSMGAPGEKLILSRDARLELARNDGLPQPFPSDERLFIEAVALAIKHGRVVKDGEVFRWAPAGGDSK